ncbi:MAG: putative lipoprotein LipL45 [Pseudobdellovibrio sp.]|jgi:hypothetical protein|nr:putative lipoprotein LipL45 [Pseudobdellovibrio sp.]
MKRNNWFVPAVITAGIILIVLSIWAPQSRFIKNFSDSNFARLIERTGVVKLQNNEMSAEISINSNYKIEALDVLRTEPGSEAVIEFNGGGQFRISEKSEVVVDQLDNGNPLVVVRSGEVFVEKFGKSPGFWIRSEGQLYSASDFVVLDRKNASRLMDPLPSQKGLAQITQAEIEVILNSKKNDFFKCFGQLIQKSPQATGQVLISFTIERQGLPSKVEVSKSDINDPHFKNCLSEVVARTRFRSFTGDPIATVFPLKFE